MSKKPKLGRPPLPKGVSRGERLFCRLLPSEVAEIEAAARNARKSKSDWIRETLLAAAPRPEPTIGSAPEFMTQNSQGLGVRVISRPLERAVSSVQSLVERAERGWSSVKAS